MAAPTAPVPPSAPHPVSRAAGVPHRQNHRTGAIALGVAALMVGAGYASVPLYRIFCQRTGYGGTPARASEAEASGVRALAGHSMSIRFDSNVEAGMHWAFTPEASTRNVGIGTRNIAFFDAENLTGQPITGRASYNIEPESAAPYFTKIQCFCFTLQTLAPHQKVRMPVIFYVDPRIVGDPQNADVHQITLSYTFHPVSVAQSAATAPG